MWFLISIRDAAVRFSLPLGKDLVVGRKDCDILIQKDQSISRKHAIIRVEENTESSSVHLTDCKSKFGTHVNGRKLSANERVELHLGDVIKFGQGPKESVSSFKLIHEPLVFCCSSMAGAEKIRVKQLAKILSAQVVSNWTPECTHLIMESVTVTVKVVSALASCRPIVTPAWLEEAVKHTSAGKVLPSCEDYLPNVVDGNIDSGSQDISFKPDYRRTSLLQDRVFFFLTEKQYTRLHLCLKSTGAQCRLTTSQSVINLETLVAKEYVVVAVDEDVLSQMAEKERKWVEKVNNFLSCRGLRPVLDSEIGFALLHISIDKYCNPRSPSGVPEACVPLPPPSLSQQASLSMHTTSLPFTQESQLSPDVTVYAVDSEATSQVVKRNAEDSTTQANTVKVNETILQKKSPIVEAIDSLFDFGDSFPPADVKSKPDLKTTSQVEGGGSTTSGFKHPKPHPSLRLESSIVDDSQPEPEVPTRTALPGLRSRSSDTSFLNKSEILAPQSVETVPSQDGSVLAPNSLTQDSSGKKSLPDSELISALFKGKRRKRGAAEDSQLEAQSLGIKRKCQEAENGEETTRRETGASLFSGLQSTRRNRTNILDDTSRSNGCLHTISTMPKAPTPSRAAITESSIRPSSSEEIMIIERTRFSTHEDRCNTDVFKTPKQKKLHSSSTPFLSTRKHHKSSREDGSGSETPAAPPLPPPEPPSETQVTNTLTQNSTRGEMTSPFTCLTMPFGTSAGRRTKSQAAPSTHADDIWNEEADGSEGIDGENPLGSQYYPTQRMYKPVCTGDGFILPREKPKLQIPRGARLGMLANNDGPKKEEEEGIPPVEVTMMNLVVSRSGGESRKQDVEDSERWRGRKNFKKFRKVQNVGAGIPRIVGVKVYVAEPSRTLQEWMEERDKEDDDNDTREEESSQDLFTFTLPSKKRQT